jgi:hypothetical protein
MEIQVKHGTIRVDDDDSDLVAPHKWSSMRTQSGNTYAYATIAGRRIYLHHLITNRAPRGKGRCVVDHVNGDGLDNRRSNLRPAINKQNGANRDSWGGRSRFKGVSWSKAHQTWQAHIMTDGRSQFLGYFEVETEAARAYDHAALDAFGEFARLNLPHRIDEPSPKRFYVRESRPRPIDPPGPPVMPVVAGMGRPGVANGNSKLTEADVRRIIDALREVPRRTQTSIAEEFGVRQAHISRIARRRSWAHLWPDGG